MFVILRRHVRLVSLAKEKVIDEREFLDAQNTLVHIAQTITQRVEELESQLFPRLHEKEYIILIVSANIVQTIFGIRVSKLAPK